MSVAGNYFFVDVRRGDLAAVKRALARQPGVLRVRGVADQRTALHVAAEVGNHLVLRTLLANGADYAAADAAGEVPLMLAARQVRPAGLGFQGRRVRAAGRCRAVVCETPYVPWDRN
jgi:hypothetical protein